MKTSPFFLHVMLLLCLTATVAQAQCYEKLLQEGNKEFQQKKYAEAIAIWQDAKKCSDCPKPPTVLNNKIKQAKTKMAEIAQKPPAVQPDTSKKKETPVRDAFSEIQMIEVKGGQYTMGSASGKNEQPPHTVQVADFRIAKYEVTQALWRRVMGSNPPNMQSKICDRCPVESVTWKEVQDFLRKIKELTGVVYRLPTEAEWEYAARGGALSHGYKYAGSEDQEEVCMSMTDAPYPVGQKKANELDICDMSGNVWEITADCWHSDFTGAPADGKAWSAEQCKRYVTRGGSWYDHERCHVTSRNFNYFENASSAIGFRLAKDW